VEGATAEENPKTIELPGGNSPTRSISSADVGSAPASKPKSKLPKKTPKEKTPPVPAKAEEPKPESPKLVYAKKSAPIPILPVLPELPVPVEKSLGVLTVVPILQNSSPLHSPDPEEEPVEAEEASPEPGRPRKAKAKGARVPVAPKGKRYKKRRKKVTVEQKLRMKQAANKKRNFDKVLNTRTQHFINVVHPKPGTDSTTNGTLTESSYASSGNEDNIPTPATQSSSSESGGKPRTPPVIAEFSWPKYLSDMNAKAAPSRLFRQPAFPPENPFK